ncbi:MAG: F0F1 ATP synthase subunit delta [Candidatus Cloacimonetes bacterium]|nr:F0F1 ATP synthase subunit delta [Candidatus Cloacimonadota bacterium]
MKGKLIAQRYSKALIRLIDVGLFPSILKDIERLDKIFSDSPQSISIMDSFLYPIKDRLEIAQKITNTLQNKEIWSNLFNLLIKKHRFSLILMILSDFETNILSLRNQIKVKLKIAHKHSPETIEKIKIKLEDLFNNKIIFKTIIDPSIIGGFVAETDSMLVDGSIKNNLIRLSKIAEY